MRKIFLNIEKVKNFKNDDTGEVYEDLWIPNFKFYSFLENLTDHISKEGKIPPLFSLLKVEMIGSHEGEIFEHNPTENSMIIDNSFIFGMTDKVIDEKVGIPLFSCLITKDKFLRI